jgi:Ni,Fe-hydrogenase maturation factor
LAKIPLKTLVLGWATSSWAMKASASTLCGPGATPAAGNMECLDGGTGGFTLLEPLENADRIILIDAAADGNPIGTVTRTTPRFSRDYPPTLTAHDIGVKDLLDMFYIQGGSTKSFSTPSPSIPNSPSA